MKQRLHIEFLPPGRPSKWAWTLCAVVCTVALVSIGLAVTKGLDLRRMRVEIAALEAQRVYAGEAANVPAASPVVSAPPYDADARIAWREGRFATAPALTALETVTVAGVTPISVELDAASGLVRVQLEFNDHAALLAYLAELNAGEAATRWALVEARTGKPDKPTAGLAELNSHW